MRGKYITTTLQLAVLTGCSQQKRVSEQSKLIIEAQQGNRSKEFLPKLQASVECAEGNDEEHNQSYFII